MIANLRSHDPDANAEERDPCVRPARKPSVSNVVRLGTETLLAKILRNSKEHSISISFKRRIPKGTNGAQTVPRQLKRQRVVTTWSASSAKYTFAGYAERTLQARFTSTIKQPLKQYLSENKTTGSIFIVLCFIHSQHKLFRR